MINCRWGVNQLGIFTSREIRPKSWHRCSRWEYCNWCSLRSPLSRASSPRGGGGTHYSRKRSFLSPSDYGERGVSPRERKHRRRWRGRGQQGGWQWCTFRVDGGVVATGAQAKKQQRVVDRNEEVTAEPGGGRGRRRRSERAARSTGSKGSYYNKFVGGLRSGNNSELRATLRMCLSLLLFKWKWKATSCNATCICVLLYSSPFLYLYGVLLLWVFVGVLSVFRSG